MPDEVRVQVRNLEYSGRELSGFLLCVKILKTSVLDIDNDTPFEKTLHMFTTGLIISTSEFDENLDRTDDGLCYKSVTTKIDTKLSCYLMP